MGGKISSQYQVRNATHLSIITHIYDNEILYV